MLVEAPKQPVFASALADPAIWSTAKTELAAYLLLACDGSLTKMRPGHGGGRRTRADASQAWWNTMQERISTLFHVLAKTYALASTSVGMFALLLPFFLRLPRDLSLVLITLVVLVVFLLFSFV